MARLARSDSTDQHTPYWFVLPTVNALRRVHGAGVAQGDVLAQVVACEEDAGLIGEPLGNDPVLCDVDAEHAPAVAVADLIDPMTAAVLVAGFDGQGRVVVAADDDVAGADVLIAGRRADWVHWGE